MQYIKQKNTYFATPKEDLKDRIEIEIGDSKQDDFFPQMKISRWDNECNCSIRLKDFTNFEVKNENEKIVLDTVDKEVHFYDLQNGYEIEILLKEKPKTNIFEFTLQDKDIDYFYQPELTEEEKKEGAIRPENVVGSYAIYAKTPKINLVGGKEYKGGKVGHIYRPKILDSSGAEIWGELQIKNGILSITVPQDFLDKAVYPVIVDPTFGYESVGASSASTANGYASKFTMNDENGTLTKITVYTKADADTITKLGALYSDVSGTPTDLLATQSAGTTGVGTTADWVDVSMNTYSLIANTVYWIAQWHSASSVIYWDTGDAGQYQFVVGSGLYPTWDDPADTGTLFARKLSIYATYTAEVVGGSAIKDIVGSGFIPAPR